MKHQCCKDVYSKIVGIYIDQTSLRQALQTNFRQQRKQECVLNLLDQRAREHMVNTCKDYCRNQRSILKEIEEFNAKYHSNGTPNKHFSIV